MTSTTSNSFLSISCNRRLGINIQCESREIEQSIFFRPKRKRVYTVAIVTYNLRILEPLRLGRSAH